MARIVLGIGTSHRPMLSTPWRQWDQRAAFDRQAPAHDFRGGRYGFDQLAAMRRDEHFEREITPETWRSRHAACQAAIERLADKYAEIAPDAAVIVGNDQRELFTEDNVPAFSVYWGTTIENRPRTPEQTAALPPGVAVAERGHAPPEDAVYPGLPELGRHIIESMMIEGFDVAASSRLPKGSGYANGIPHAYGFIYRRIMRDAVIPNVPVILNTFYPPNQPTASRCHEFGKALGRAIESWPADQRVAVFASGGVSHFVIDEVLDRTVLKALQENDAKALTAIPEDHFRSGSSEIKNWIPVAAIMAERGLDMTLVDYVPCYRSVAGTGNAMAFTYWQ
jgi:3-O-methylgallate 3,4-dioxygenase